MLRIFESRWALLMPLGVAAVYVLCKWLRVTPGAQGASYCPVSESPSKVRGQHSRCGPS